MYESGWSLVLQSNGNPGSVLVRTGSPRKSTEAGFRRPGFWPWHSLFSLASQVVWTAWGIFLAVTAWVLWPWASSRTHVTEMSPRLSHVYPVPISGLRTSRTEGKAWALSLFQGDQFWSQFRKDWALGLGGVHSWLCLWPSQSLQVYPVGWLTLQTHAFHGCRSLILLSLGPGEILLLRKFLNFHFTKIPGWQDELKP